MRLIDKIKDFLINSNNNKNKKERKKISTNYSKFICMSINDKLITIVNIWIRIFVPLQIILRISKGNNVDSLIFDRI